MNAHLLSAKTLKTIIIIAIVIPCSATLLFSQAITGDPNNSGSIDIIDALLVAQYYVGLAVPDPFDRTSADVNCSGSIDIVDALLIAQYYVKLINGFTGCNPTPVPTPDPGEIEHTRLIEEWARTQGIDLRPYNIVPIKSDPLNKVIPGYAFYLVYLVQYPLASGPADEFLGTNCIMAINGNMEIEAIPDEFVMEEFYRTHQIAITTEEGCVLAIKAWLHLSQEYKNDGFYTFLVAENDIIVNHVYGDVVEWMIEGISKVVSGGEGAINATMAIDFMGLLQYVYEEFELIPGVRPVCQSTKLLDKDPIVRKMAEQDLLAMGYSAWDYLQTQRAKASPELQKAMDAIWERIVKQEEKRVRIRELLSGE